MNNRESTIKDLVFESSRKFLHDFEKTVGNFEERGILNSEMLLVCAVSEELGVEVFIESGRWKGQSTQILTKYFEGKPVLIESIEAFWDENAAYVEKKLKGKDNLNLHYGDAHELIPKLAKKHKNKKVAFLFDGPKGQAALDIFRLALSYSDGIVAGFFHDMRKPVEGMPTASRYEMEGVFRQAFYTDDKEFVAEFSYLDESCKVDIWHPYSIDGKPIGSYGPTIGFVFPSQEDKKSANKEKIHLSILAWKRRLVLYSVRIYHLLKRLFRI